MIIKKAFLFTTEKLDEVIVAVADEIKAGYSVESITQKTHELSVETKDYPRFEVVLVRRCR